MTAAETLRTGAEAEPTCIDCGTEIAPGEVWCADCWDLQEAHHRAALDEALPDILNDQARDDRRIHGL